MNKQILLSKVAGYSESRVNGSAISVDNYVTTDSMLQGKNGITHAAILPKGNLIAFKEGDILIGNIRPYLKKIWYSNRDGGCSPDVLVIKSKTGIDSKFLFYTLFRDDFFIHMMNGSKGTKMPRGDKSQILRFQIPDIDIFEQQKIATILSSIDLKIQLNIRINAELEAMAKTLYDYWFVQFDFPDENGKPYKTSGGKMTWSEELKREIPEGWGYLDLGDFEKNIITGKTPTTINESNFNGDVPFICIGDIRGNMHIVNTELTLTRSGAETQSNKFIPKGAICVSCIASPGLIAFATSNSQTNQQINSIVCQVEENRYFLYFFLKDYFKYAKAKTGNTFANMNKSDFSSIKILRPSKEILSNFHQHLDSSIKMILSMSIQNQKLAQIRDWLLPMLMNGQVKVN